MTLYTPNTLKEYLDIQKGVLKNLDTDPDYTDQRIKGRIDMLRTIIQDLEIILAGPQEIV